MREPVLAADGYSYERRNIEEVFSRNAGKTLKSPMTNEELTKTDLFLTRLCGQMEPPPQSLHER